ncbi:hypothetical protein MKX01_041217 [Papaver californicum]|nr:hypothetical protein MKX01_041217 [Papaver californicum]
MIWMHTPHGNYSPQSLQKCPSSMAGETSSVSNSIVPWRKFWATKRIAPKIKMFLWRAIHDGLGVLKRVGKYVEGVPTDCQIFHSAEECINHIILHCSFSQAVWFASPFWTAAAATL